MTGKKIPKDIEKIADQIGGDSIERAEIARAILAERERRTNEVQGGRASLRMIADAIGELFGPAASIESEDASLLRGPEFHHFAEGIVEALRRVADDRERLALAERERISAELFNRDCFLTSVTGDGDPYLKFQFKTEAERNDFHRAISELSKASKS
jgi:hypothetical protein